MTKLLSDKRIVLQNLIILSNAFAFYSLSIIFKISLVVPHAGSMLDFRWRKVYERHAFVPQRLRYLGIGDYPDRRQFTCAYCANDSDQFQDRLYWGSRFGEQSASGFESHQE